MKRNCAKTHQNIKHEKKPTNVYEKVHKCFVQDYLKIFLLVSASFKTLKMISLSRKNWNHEYWPPALEMVFSTKFVLGAKVKIMSFKINKI